MANSILSDRIAEDIKCYVGMKIDSAKLAAVEHLSTLVGKGIGLIVALLLSMLALMLLTAAAVYGLGLLIDSMIWAVVIVAVVYILLAILFFKKPTVFINSMVGVFSKMFFNPKKDRNELQM